MLLHLLRSSVYPYLVKRCYHMLAEKLVLLKFAIYKIEEKNESDWLFPSHYLICSGVAAAPLVLLTAMHRLSPFVLQNIT